ncbi:hypothetical protein M0208_01450 [Sphingomonas sp. SUN019]|uniref:hypothetical protein n=1 Tax=Sphingomonas sp. SUN019 TaxID=2937788 RepID=UPI0021641133|nr:hypothetical protein [Sphingomonas sp. SUN019]UVO49246.1 hypothetical protein M0208_01450 [Sphingomonas sp. SUN019]
MPVFKTGTNRVVADDPEPGDAFVQVTWFGPSQDGKHRKQFHTRPQPIEEYQAAIDWAVSMADQMAFPLYVVPLRAGQLLTPERLERAVASMTDQERGELRRLVVTTCAEIMRDCEEIEVREGAFSVLAKMGVVDDDGR